MIYNEDPHKHRFSFDRCQKRLHHEYFVDRIDI